ncbi:MAG: ferrous iron transport protein A [Clostridia bacterium]|nr:ferrous iron transport protein A [Clostridia bacterium]
MGASTQVTVRNDNLRLVSLCDINTGEKVRVVKILSDISIKRRFMDLGLIEDTIVECKGHSPMNDPSAYLIRGAVIAIRKADAKGVKCQYIG